MCFSWGWSLGFSILGSVLAAAALAFHKNPLLAVCVAYFTLMEILQCVQYALVSPSLDDPQCSDPGNVFFTWLGVTHIAFQPFFITLFFKVIRPEYPSEACAWKVIQRISLFSAAFWLARGILAPEEMTPNQRFLMENSTDWLQGSKTCSYIPDNWSKHISWSVKLHTPSYFLPNSFVHFFLCFFPVIALDFWTLPAVLLVVLTGPALSVIITGNLHEQPAIWCLFSIAQILLFLSYEMVVVGQNWTPPNKISPYSPDASDQPSRVPLLIVSMSKTKSEKAEKG